MKKANMTLDFKNDHAVIFDQSIQLILTKSGHYDKSKNDIVIKHHRQFSHSSPEKLLKLLNSAADPWQSDKELKKLIKKVSDECAICKIYRKTPPRPIVGLPMAT